MSNWREFTEDKKWRWVVLPWRLLDLLYPPLALFYLFLFITDYSFVGYWRDVVFILTCGPFLIFYPFSRPIRNRLLQFVVLGNRIINFGTLALTFLVAIVMVMPPFTLGFIFFVDEVAGGRLIQNAESPNGMQVAEVYYRGVGAYASGNGRKLIRVRNVSIPFLEHEVYFQSGSGGVGGDEEIYWTDDTHLYVSETDSVIEVKPVRFELPWVVTQLLNILIFLIRLIF